MSGKTKIEWTNETWNPVRGCTKVSPGCKNCYAELQSKRFAANRLSPYYRVGFDVRVDPDELDSPLRQTKSAMFFVNSMSDLFEEQVPDEFITAVCEVMERASWHIFQVLTKRDKRLHKLLNGKLRWAAELQHVWWGVSVENRKHGLPRLDRLRNTPAKVKFLSIEPLLEDLGRIDLTGIDWVIVGGESGPRSRPMDPQWVLSIRDQCAAAKVKFFFKQWGGRNKKAAGRTLDGRTYDGRPNATFGPLPANRRALVQDCEREMELLRPLVQHIARPRRST
jgi:protein gp37